MTQVASLNIRYSPSEVLTTSNTITPPPFKSETVNLSAVGDVAEVFRLSFDRSRLPEAWPELQTGDPLGFNYERMLVGEESVRSGRYRPLDEAMGELRRRNNPRG